MESELANALINSATTVVYIAGLFAFVTWLQKSSKKHHSAKLVPAKNKDFTIVRS